MTDERAASPENFEVVRDAIRFLESEYPGGWNAITPAAAKAALDAVAICEALGTTPPQIFATDEDNLVLSWKTAAGNFYCATGENVERGERGESATLPMVFRQP